MIYEKIRIIRIAVCNHYGISKQDFFGEKRNRLFFHARMTFAWILRKRFRMTLYSIAEMLNRDHTTIINMLQKMEDYFFINDYVAKDAAKIDKQIFEETQIICWNEQIEY